ncbi:hypothetical protein L7F22_064576 [Adiantum nelumboides]|nr:hypothetical protein [Adiantum nelumboides]
MALSMEPGMAWGTDAGSATFASSDNYISRASSRNDDDEALKWAALEKLPTYSRLRKGFLKNLDPAGSVTHEEVDIAKLGFAEKQQLLEKVVRDIENDNERFLHKLRERINKVGIDLPKIEVRFKHLNVEADVQVGSRVLPTLVNFTFNLLEGLVSVLFCPKRKVLHILKDVSGIIKPSRLTLLLGPPSSEKTSLLLALAGKLSSDLRVSGNVTYNGHELHEFIPQRTSAYISQHDTQYGMMTVRETLDFSSRCQGVGTRYEMLSELSRREKGAVIKPDVDIDVFMKAASMEGQQASIVTDYTMKMLDLDICADTIVGDQMKRGISGGQRKRVTTGEMLVGPAKALFMDEISTGLDSSTTFQILLLMKRGGRVIYAGRLGTRSAELIENFEAIPGIRPITDGYNPATWMLEISSPSAEARLQVDFAKIYKESALYRRNQALIKEVSVPLPDSKDLFFPTKYPQSFPEQCLACLWKQHKSYWRNPHDNAVRFLFTVAVALIFGTIFWRLGHKTSTTADLFNIFGAMYSSSLFIGFQNANTGQPVVAIERTVFYRERGAGMYSALAYAFAQAAVEIPYCFTQGTLYVLLTYTLINFFWTAAKFFYFFYFMFFTLITYTYVGFMTVAITLDLYISTIITSGFLNLWNLFSGFMIPRVHIPQWWRWYYWANPLAWSLYGLIGSQLSDVESNVEDPDAGPTRVKDFLNRAFGFKHDFLGAVAGANLGFALLFLFVFAYGIKKLNFQKR